MSLRDEWSHTHTRARAQWAAALLALDTYAMMESSLETKKAPVKGGMAASKRKKRLVHTFSFSTCNVEVNGERV